MIPLQLHRRKTSLPLQSNFGAEVARNARKLFRGASPAITGSAEVFANSGNIALASPRPMNSNLFDIKYREIRIQTIPFPSPGFLLESRYFSSSKISPKIGEKRAASSSSDLYPEI